MMLKLHHWNNINVKSENMKSGEPSSYCKYRFDLRELVRSKDAPISHDALHGFKDVLTLSKLDLSLHKILS
jgi:hypothetical protein